MVWQNTIKFNGFVDHTTLQDKKDWVIRQFWIFGNGFNPNMFQFRTSKPFGPDIVCEFPEAEEKDKFYRRFFDVYKESKPTDNGRPIFWNGYQSKPEIAISKYFVLF